MAGSRGLVVAEAQSLADVMWIDARGVEAYADGHIPGALPLNEDDWESLITPVMLAWTPDRTVIVYCGGASCQASREVADRLEEELGVDSVRVLRGGWPAWRDAQ